MGQFRDAKNLAAELAAVDPNNDDQIHQLLVRVLGTIMVSLARIADAADRSAPMRGE